MGFCLTHLLKAILLFLNAAAILNEKRVLKYFNQGNGAASSFENQEPGAILNFIKSVQTLMRRFFSILIFYFYFIFSSFDTY
jgi:hypothetical protein